jgi:hypothetical protein
MFLTLNGLLEMGWNFGSTHLMIQVFFFYKLDRACCFIFSSLGQTIRVGLLNWIGLTSTGLTLLKNRLGLG